MADRTGSDLVSSLSAQLQRFGRDVPGTRLRSRPQQDQPLGPCLRTCIEKRLRRFRRPHCGSVRIDETYVKIRSKWPYLYRAIDKHGNPIVFMFTAKRNLDAAKRFFRKRLKNEPLLSPGKIGADGNDTFPSTINTAVNDGHLHPDPFPNVTKHLQQIDAVVKHHDENSRPSHHAQEPSVNAYDPLKGGLIALRNTTDYSAAK
jgi:transposase, IS6 family